MYFLGKDLSMLCRLEIYLDYSPTKLGVVLFRGLG
jgi:hypothetical protein